MSMPLFCRLLKLLAPIFLVVAALHLALGLGADALLGAQVSAQAAAEPSLNSQNRFYGVAFALYGLLLYVCASDLRRYVLILRMTLWVFFFAGLSRVLSWAMQGPPAPMVIGLAAVELIAPPLLLFWLYRIDASNYGEGVSSVG